MAQAPSARPLIFITLGLALLDIWCDVLGHGSATVGAADLVADALTNGRVFWNVSLVAFCGAIVLAPRWFTDHHRPWDLAVPAVAAAGTVFYALSPALAPSAVLPTVCIILTGVCYGWLEARLFFEAARLEKLVISDATVKSHTNHIYQKLGVHSKQDLITLVREREKTREAPSPAGAPSQRTIGELTGDRAISLRKRTPPPSNGLEITKDRR